MGFRWLWFTVIVVVARAAELTDEEYLAMPRLFELDDWESCLASRRGVFCLGSFDLLPSTNTALLQTIREFSADKYHFNHTHIHRGYCVSSRCGGLKQQGSSARSRFETCVGNVTRSQYGLETNLTQLQYCRSARQSGRVVDSLDMAFAYCCGVILLLNLLGTAYDFLRNQDSKPNKYLITWSLRVNWQRLTANYTEGDPRLSALKPVQGMKALTLILIMLAHSVLAYHLTYVQNPLFLEKSSHHPLSVYFQNGTSIVHTFIMASSFLLAYNLLLHDGGKRRLGLHMLPKCFVHRLTRILPVYLFVLGAAATWWVHFSDGPLWSPLVGGECKRCRDKWWTQLLFINNLIRPDVKCLIHTWFLAVDMQLYVVSAVLTLALGRSPRLALKLLAGLLLLSLTGNFLASYFFDLRPMVTLMFPEYMRTQFEGEVSFKWLYQAPWDSAPAALIGIFAAFLHHTLQQNGVQPKDSLVFRTVYRLTVPCMFLWVFLGYFMKGVTSPGALAVYAAVDRPAFIMLTATAMIGFFNQIDSLWWRFLSWRGWEVLGRMSLSIYLVHWLYALTQLAMRAHPSPASIHEIGGHFLWTVFVSYLTALPLHLFVELPMQKFLQSLFS